MRVLDALPRDPHVLLCGYVDDARYFEASGRSWSVGGASCLPEIADCAVHADARWVLAGIWMLAWLTEPEGTEA